MVSFLHRCVCCVSQAHSLWNLWWSAERPQCNRLGGACSQSRPRCRGCGPRAYQQRHFGKCHAGMSCLTTRHAHLTWFWVVCCRSNPFHLLSILELGGCPIHCSPCRPEVWRSHPRACSHCEQTVWVWLPVYHQWYSCKLAFKILTWIPFNWTLSLKVASYSNALCVCRRSASESQRWFCVEVQRAWARLPMLFATFALEQSLDLILRFVFVCCLWKHGMCRKKKTCSLEEDTKMKSLTAGGHLVGGSDWPACKDTNGNHSRESGRKIRDHTRGLRQICLPDAAKVEGRWETATFDIFLPAKSAKIFCLGAYLSWILILDGQTLFTAHEGGHFTAEIAPVDIKTKKGKVPMAQDEHPRPQTTPEQMAKLPSVFKKGGTVTAGNASVRSWTLRL